MMPQMAEDYEQVETAAEAPDPKSKMAAMARGLYERASSKGSFLSALTPRIEKPSRLPAVSTFSMT